MKQGPIIPTRTQIQTSSEAGNRGESGIVLILLAIGTLGIILSVAAYSLNSGWRSSIRAEIQAAVDSAAHAAAVTLCSTRACFNDARAAAIDRLRKTLPTYLEGSSGQAVSISQGGGPEWNFDNLTIRIERGRWWTDIPRTIASRITTHPDNDHFESLEDSDWQEIHAGEPRHVVSNATFVSVEYTFEMPLLNILGAFNTLISESVYAYPAGLETEQICVAPFAIPVCALLDESGEFQKRDTCKMERYFTETDRYCDDPRDPGCRTVPGTTYTPLYDPADTHYQDGLRNIPWENRQRMQCSWETYPRADFAGDHFGIVGVPARALGAFPLDEAFIQRTLANPSIGEDSDGCVRARIGDEFRVLHDGLVDPASDTLVWNHIRDSNGDAVEHHPDWNSTQLLGAVSTGHVTMQNFLPVWDLDYQSRVDYCSDYQPAHNNAGVCRSKYLTLHQRCYYETIRIFGCSGPFSIFCNCDPFGFGDFVLSAFPQEGCPIDENGDIDFNYLAVDPSDSLFAIWLTEAVFDSSLEIPAGLPAAQRTRRIWNVPIPVIASLGDVRAGNPAASCRGVGLNQGETALDDPPVSDRETQIIIGFIDAHLYDNDIGPGPPNTPTENDFNRCDQHLLEDDRGRNRTRPFSFKDETGLDCNMVKGVVDCDAGLISSIGDFKVNAKRIIRLFQNP